MYKLVFIENVIKKIFLLFKSTICCVNKIVRIFTVPIGKNQVPENRVPANSFGCNQFFLVKLWFKPISGIYFDTM